MTPIFDFFDWVEARPSGGRSALIYQFEDVARRGREGSEGTLITRAGLIVLITQGSVALPMKPTARTPMI